MKKIAFAAAAILIVSGAAFAGSSNDADRPSTWATQSVQGSSFGASATIPVTGSVVVAPQYDDSGYLPTDIAGARSLAIKPSAAPTGFVVAPSYSSSGHLPGDRF